MGSYFISEIVRCMSLFLMHQPDHERCPLNGR